MLDRWLELYNDARLKLLTTTQRVAAANGILLAESQGSSGTGSSSSPLYKAEDGSGIVSLQEMREGLRNSTDVWNTAPEEEIVRIYSELTGKVWRRL